MIMKKISLTALLALTSLNLFAGITNEKGKFYIHSKKGKAPILKVNELLASKKIKNPTIYGNGKVNAISFKSSQGTMLYSVDEKGFIYSIEPFSKYDISKVHSDGKFEFKQIPNRKYSINENGFFLY